MRELGLLAIRFNANSGAVTAIIEFENSVVRYWLSDTLSSVELSSSCCDASLTTLDDDVINGVSRKDARFLCSRCNEFTPYHEGISVWYPLTGSEELFEGAFRYHVSPLQAAALAQDFSGELHSVWDEEVGAFLKGNLVDYRFEDEKRLLSELAVVARNSKREYT